MWAWAILLVSTEHVKSILAEGQIYMTCFTILNRRHVPQPDTVFIPIVHSGKGDTNIPVFWKLCSIIPIFIQIFTLILSTTAFPHPPNFSVALLGLYRQILESQCIGLPCPGILGKSLLHPLTILPTHMHMALSLQTGVRARDPGPPVSPYLDYNVGVWRSDFCLSSLSSGFLNISKLGYIEQTCLEPFRVGGPSGVLINPPKFQECCSKTFVLTISIPLYSSHFFLLLLLLIYLFLAVLGLHCCARAFSSCSERGLLFVAVHGLFSLQWLLLLQSRGSRHAGFSTCGTWAQQLWLAGSRVQAQ